MPYSMTAFARVSTEQPWGSLVCELRSVNHRYLELHFRLPETLRDSEMPIREQARKALQRGKIDVAFHLHLNRTQQHLELNQSLLAEVIASTEQVAAMMANPAPINPAQILQWPGVMIESEVDADAIKHAALALFGRAVDELKSVRLREGDALKQLIMERLDAIAEQVTVVRGVMPEVMQMQRERLHNRFREASVELDNERVEAELVLLANRSDVAEELDRLEAHTKEVRHALNSKGAIGRRLDFLMQELNREANTLGSKSLVVETTKASVEIKVLIEQMREQIQNIE